MVGRDREGWTINKACFSVLKLSVLKWHIMGNWERIFFIHIGDKPHLEHITLENGCILQCCSWKVYTATETFISREIWMEPSRDGTHTYTQMHAYTFYAQASTVILASQPFLVANSA